MRKTNYHTHTKRCMHAIGTDEEYVLAAIQGGYEELGFSDHTPWHYNSNFIATMRMRESQFDEYYKSISSLKEKYKDQISIKIGLECEYFPGYMDWLKKLITDYKLDYIILGHHHYLSDELRIYFGQVCNEDEYLEKYVDLAIEAMETGLYSYMAHPDLFMRGRSVFDDFAKEQSYRLCRAAKRLNMPLEYNLAGAEFSEKTHREEYPHHEFWKIAADVKNTAIIGVDAHDPEKLTIDEYRNEGLKRLENLGIEVIDTISFEKF